MTTKDINYQTEEIYSRLKRLTNMSASKDSLVEATAKIMQAKILADGLESISSQLARIGKP